MDKERDDLHLQLAPFSVNQAQSLYDLTHDSRAYLRQWLPWLDSIKALKDSHDFIVETLKRDSEGKSLNYFILFNDELIGTIGIRDIKDQAGILGYWIAQSFAGKGLATKACERIITIAKETLDLNLITLRCAPDNVASKRIAEKCGFEYIKTMKNAENLYGKLNDLLVYQKKLD